MAKAIKVLMVDDHPIIIEGYKNILSDLNSKKINFNIDIAGSCDKALGKLQESINGTPYNIIFLDINLPASKDQKVLSGEDLGLIIRNDSPISSIVVLTMYKENYRLYNILKTLNPEAFLIKSDVTSKEFKEAVLDVLDNKFYYSYSVRELLRKQIITEVNLDNLDRSILFHLSQGLKMKDLSDIIPLSLAALEKRKKNMKEAFNVEDGGDLLLLNKARQLGFL